jgi:hypothetical protein
MDTDGGGGAAPSPASHGRASGVSNRASTALAAVSVFLILLYLFWRFVWQYLKHERGSVASSAAATATSSSSTPAPSCPSRDGAEAYGAGEAARRTPRATTTPSPLPVFVRVAATPAGFGAEKVDCAVCLTELGDDGLPAARLVPGCGHGFHAECIEAWFRVNSTCPLCRAAVQSAGDETPPRHCSSV